MKKMDLKDLIGMGSATMAKLGKDELVSMDVIMRICDMLECDVGDIMEMIPDERF